MSPTNAQNAVVRRKLPPATSSAEISDFTDSGLKMRSFPLIIMNTFRALTKPIQEIIFFKIFAHFFIKII